MIGKKLHRDMAEVNVYTARRLREMACSLGWPGPLRRKRDPTKG